MVEIPRNKFDPEKWKPVDDRIKGVFDKPLYATQEELAARGDQEPITFPLNAADEKRLRATPAELAARAAKKAAEAAQKSGPAPTTNEPKTVPAAGHKGYHKVEVNPKAKGLIAADVPQRPGLFQAPRAQGYVAAPNIEHGHHYIFAKPDSGDQVKIKADLFYNYQLMDPLTRDNHVPEGKVLVHVGNKYLIVDKNDHEAIRILEESGGKVIVSK